MNHSHIIVSMSDDCALILARKISDNSLNRALADEQTHNKKKRPLVLSELKRRIAAVAASERFAADLERGLEMVKGIGHCPGCKAGANASGEVRETR